MELPDLDRPLDLLAVAPHPDDLEIICGGTLAKLAKQGYHVGMIDLTTGEPTPRGSVEIRMREAEAARKILGVPVRVCLELPNRVLMDGPEVRYALATAIRKLQPTVLLTIAGRTPAASPDHNQAHLLIEAARFYSQLTKWDERFENTHPYRVPHLVYAPFPFDAEQRQFHATVVIDISSTFEQKMQAIACYQSQFAKQRMEKVEHWVRGQNAYHGGTCGYRYGELFALPTPVGGEDLITVVCGSKGTPAPVNLNIPGQSHLPMG